MRPTIDFSGKKIGSWIVISRAGSSRAGALWLCRCRCGFEQNIAGARLKSGATKMCAACAQKSRKHDFEADTKFIDAWQICENIEEVAKTLGISKQVAIKTALRMRVNHIPLKKMKKVPSNYYPSLVDYFESLKKK